ncbi:MAG: His/Gly/Thr/Pro-type tRNA ligase C-terminal domain-containing protein [Anaerolineales bacterium]
MMLANDELWQKSDAMKRLFTALEALNVLSYVRYAPNIVRGLDYYTSTVFEAWDVEGEFRALFGGGRYDNLVEAVGGDPLPATGFAMGDVVISLLLKEYGLLPEGLDISPAPLLVTVFDDTTLIDSIALADELRRQGFNVSCYPEPAKLGKQFKYADRIGAQAVVVLGPDEIKSGKVTIKALSTGTQITCTRQEAGEKIREMVNQQK